MVSVPSGGEVSGIREVCVLPECRLQPIDEGRLGGMHSLARLVRPEPRRPVDLRIAATADIHLDCTR